MLVFFCWGGCSFAHVFFWEEVSGTVLKPADVVCCGGVVTPEAPLLSLGGRPPPPTFISFDMENVKSAMTWPLQGRSEFPPSGIRGIFGARTIMASVLAIRKAGVGDGRAIVPKEWENPCPQKGDQIMETHIAPLHIGHLQNMELHIYR